MAEAVSTVTDETFASDVLGNALPVLVDFWAQWCVPCKRMAPLLDELAAEHAERLRVAKLDIDTNRDTAMRYGVMSIPTLKVFRDGAVVHTIVGQKTKSQLLAELADFVGRPTDG